MNLLIFDHFFWQDIEALKLVGGEHSIRVMPYTLLHDVASKYLPRESFVGLEGYLEPDVADAWAAYQVEALRLFEEQYLAFPFDVLILPSDTYFYLRPWIPAAHALGIPVIVLQKETTISPYTMVEYAQGVGKYTPFISDLMTVCSERQKQFWLNTGAPADKFVVTGQPRFDFYRQSQRWKSWRELGLDVPADRPVLLFLSYDLGAYSPLGDGVRTWDVLRGETEQVLVELAREGRWTVLVKPHPQQSVEDETARLRQLAGEAWGRRVQLIAGMVDARHLLVNSDAVVGFQTTALLEAMTLDKKTVYTFWTEPAVEHSPQLVPFHEMDGALHVARGPDHLREILAAGNTPADEARRARTAEICLEHLGPLDGACAQRSLQTAESFAREYARLVSAEAKARRAAMDVRVAGYCRRELRKARAQRLAWRGLQSVSPAIYPLYYTLRRLRPIHGHAPLSYERYRSVFADRVREARESDCRLRETLRLGRTS